MELLLVCGAAFAASGLTLFSGFGLGTLLMPVFALFFPVPAAVGMTAVVHFANNLFKLALLGRRADRGVVLRFGLPAVVAASAGALALSWLVALPALASYEAFGRSFLVEPVKLVVGAALVAFAVLDAAPSLQKLSFDARLLPVGGALSGFFGGLSGHQGALRSAFLIRCGLSKEAFVATGVVIACLVDLTRLSAYAARFSVSDLGTNAGLLGAATLSAFAGAYGGNRLLAKVTIRAVQRIVAAMLVFIGAALGAGLI